MERNMPFAYAVIEKSSLCILKASHFTVFCSTLNQLHLVVVEIINMSQSISEYFDRAYYHPPIFLVTRK
ncbi:hypothetical protein RJT34_32509 [Clitoria ternatea]|uniref:Uncharacterized protein n=1 Tax=Clitoria ternatea TaxID=43366 RepID=A0AAN9I9J7_CLITE